MLLLLPSLAPDHLAAIFQDVIQKYLFAQSETKEPSICSELKVYLLKFTDKIVHLCKGSLVLGPGVLS